VDLQTERAITDEASTRTLTAAVSGVIF